MREFVPEAEELIDVLHQNLHQIEALPNKDNVKPDVVNAIFRAAHTLKGMSGMVGLDHVCKVSHHFEDILDKVRMGKATFTPEILNLLIDGVSLLQTMIKAASQGKPEPSAAFFEDRIRLSLSEKPKVEGEDLLSGMELPLALPNLLTEYEHHRLIQNIKTGFQLFEVVANFPLETFDTDLSALNNRMREIGEVIATLPGPSPTGGMEFRIIVATPSDAPDLADTIVSEFVTVRNLSKPKGAAVSTGSVVSTKNPPPAISASPGVPQPLGEQSLQVQDENAVSQSASDESNAALGDADSSDLESIRSLSQTVRVDIEKLDLLLNMVGELVISKGQISEISRRLLGQEGISSFALEVQKASKMLDKRISEFQEKLVEVRMTPIGQIFDRLVRVVHKVSKDLGKEVNLLFSGEDTKMDKSMVEELSDPLLHLILNALDHGLESYEDRIAKNKPTTGTIMVRAEQRGNHVVVEVEDDGQGMDTEKILKKGLEKGLAIPGKQYSQSEMVKLLFLPGFSTRDKVTQVSGRGVGLDVVAKNIAKLSGMVDVETVLGQGTLFTLTLPITLVIIKALIVEVENETFAIPLSSVLESMILSEKGIRTIERQEVIQLREETLMLVRLKEIFDLQQGAPSNEPTYVVVVGLVEKRMGLIVNSIKGQQEVVVKSLGEDLKSVKGISGVTEIGDGKAILVLDVAALIQEVTEKREEKVAKVA
ncbi:MAG: chemotaxis protein CheA [Nitrospirota bacterium]